MTDIDYEAMWGDELLDHVYGLRDEVADLSQKRAELEYELAEARSEIRRHHEALEGVSKVAEYLDREVRDIITTRPVTDWQVSMLAEKVREIRNIVG